MAKTASRSRTDKVKKVGFIGVGLMGHGMAKNLLLKGFPLAILGHRNRKPVADLRCMPMVVMGHLVLKQAALANGARDQVEIHFQGSRCEPFLPVHRTLEPFTKVCSMFRIRLLDQCLEAGLHLLIGALGRPTIEADAVDQSQGLSER